MTAVLNMAYVKFQKDGILDLAEATTRMKDKMKDEFELFTNSCKETDIYAIYLLLKDFKYQRLAFDLFARNYYSTVKGRDPQYRMLRLRKTLTPEFLGLLYQASASFHCNIISF